MSNPEVLYWSYAQTRAWVALRDHEVLERAETHPDQASNLSLAIHKAILDPDWRGQPGPDADQQSLAALQTGELRSWRINGDHCPEIPAEQWAGLLARSALDGKRHVQCGRGSCAVAATTGGVQRDSSLREAAGGIPGKPRARANDS